MKASLRVNRLTGLSTVRRMIPCRKVGAASERICLSVGGFDSLIQRRNARESGRFFLFLRRLYFLNSLSLKGPRIFHGSI